MNRTPYDMNHVMMFKDTLFDENFNLLNIHGFEVGSSIILKPDILAAYKAFFASDEPFMKKYGSGVFTVSMYQGDLLYHDIMEANFEISFDMEEEDIKKMLRFFKYHTKRTGKHFQFGWNSDPVFFCIQLDCIEPLSKLQSFPFSIRSPFK